MAITIDRSTDYSGTHVQFARLLRNFDRLGLLMILGLGACLNLLRLGKEGYGNPYYAAAVRSMLQSWHNFFFVSFDPGGFVSVDKPPLGFWIQTASAKLFGFHGWSILLPQALAGVISVFLLFLLVRRAFGPAAGLVAALALAITPVAVADSRNNTIDSLVVLALLLAAWCVLRAVEDGRLRWLLLGMALTGLGFNIKMLQAYLALPALLAVYLAAAPLQWRTRIVHLGLATLVLLAASLSWVVAVDLTPASQRPYVGSSQHNSELELAFGYNGVERLLGMTPPGSPPGGRRTGDDGRRARQAPLNPTAGPAFQQTVAGGPPTAGDPANAAQFRPPEGGPPGFVEGSPSPLRLFDTQLGGQASWLMSLAVTGGLAALAASLRRPQWAGVKRAIRLRPNPVQQHLILWSLWLLTGGAFFSVAGFFHPYYLIMLAPSIAALSGIGTLALWRAAQRTSPFGWLLPLALLVTAATQVYLLSPYPDWERRLAPPIVGLALLGATASVAALLRPRSRLVAPLLAASVALGLGGLLIAPAVWSMVTVAQANGGGMPAGGPATFPRFARGAPRGEPPAGPLRAPGMQTQAQSRLVTYLEANRGSARFLVAVPSSMDASPIIIQTGQPVMAMGGFTGSDPILTAEQTAQDVRDGSVRFFLLGSLPARFPPVPPPGGLPSGPVPSFSQSFPGAAAGPAGAAPPSFGGQPPAGMPGPGFPSQASAAVSWVTANCSPVPASEWQASGAAPSGPGLGIGFSPGGRQQLYDCAATSP